MAVIGLIFLMSCSSAKLQQSKKMDTIRVMTYNVHHCNPPGSTEINVDMIADVIKAHGADIVAVQEVDVNTNRSGGINQAALLASKAGYPSFYFGKAMDFDGGGYGVLVLSKYPLSDTQTYRLPSAAPGKDEPRVLAAATVSLPGGKTIRFGSTHLEAYNKQSRLLQANALAKIAGGSELPFIIAGDFNDTENSEVMQVIDASFSKSCTICPATFWEDGDTGAIDFITFAPRKVFKAISHQVISDTRASDHFPVVAELRRQD